MVSSAVRRPQKGVPAPPIEGLAADGTVIALRGSAMPQLLPCLRCPLAGQSRCGQHTSAERSDPYLSAIKHQEGPLRAFIFQVSTLLHRLGIPYHTLCGPMKKLSPPDENASSPFNSVLLSQRLETFTLHFGLD
jgi:hypothetical protein